MVPQLCGTTFHQITKLADAGEIIHQCVPELLSGDTIHDVGARCVVKARDELRKIFDTEKIDLLSNIRDANEFDCIVLVLSSGLNTRKELIQINQI